MKIKDTSSIFKYSNSNLNIEQLKNYNKIQESFKGAIQHYEIAISIYEILLKNKIEFFEQIEQIKDEEAKNLIDTIGDRIHFLLPKFEFEDYPEIIIPQLEGIDYSQEQLEQHLEKLKVLAEQYGILKNRIENIENFNVVKTVIENYVENLNSKYNDVIQKRFLSNEYFYSKIYDKTNKDILTCIKLYEFWLDQINIKNRQECISQGKPKILKEDFTHKYNECIKRFKEYLEEDRSYLQSINEIIYHNQQKKGILRPNAYYNSQTPYKKEISINEISNLKNNQKKILNLLKKEAPEEYEKIRTCVNEADSQNEDIKQVFNKTVSILIGKKLSRHASMAYKAICGLAYREFAYGNIKTLSDKIKIKTSSFWDLCNIKKTSTGYDSRAKNIIRDAIANELKETIFYEDKKSFFITSFVFSFENEEDNTCTFRIEDMFLVAEYADEYSYYCCDIEGCNRLMDQTNNSEKAYWLHHYLEHSIKRGEQEFNISTLLKAAHLSDKYFKERKKKEAITKLNQILDAMISAHTLIYKWECLPSNSDPAGKYILFNLRLKNRIVNIKSKKAKKQKIGNFH